MGFTIKKKRQALKLPFEAIIAHALGLLFCVDTLKNVPGLPVPAPHEAEVSRDRSRCTPLKSLLFTQLSPPGEDPQPQITSRTLMDRFVDRSPLHHGPRLVQQWPRSRLLPAMLG